jgi:hypothetical protein
MGSEGKDAMGWEFVRSMVFFGLGKAIMKARVVFGNRGVGCTIWASVYF